LAGFRVGAAAKNRRDRAKTANSA